MRLPHEEYNHIAGLSPKGEAPPPDPDGMPPPCYNSVARLDGDPFGGRWLTAGMADEYKDRRVRPPEAAELRLTKRVWRYSATLRIGQAYKKGAAYSPLSALVQAKPN